MSKLTYGVPAWLCEWLGTDKHYTQTVVLRFSNKELATAEAKVVTNGIESIKHFIVGLPLTPVESEKQQNNSNITPAGSLSPAGTPWAVTR